MIPARGARARRGDRRWWDGRSRHRPNTRSRWARRALARAVSARARSRLEPRELPDRAALTRRSLGRGACSGGVPALARARGGGRGAAAEDHRWARPLGRPVAARGGAREPRGAVRAARRARDRAAVRDLRSRRRRGPVPAGRRDRPRRPGSPGFRSLRAGARCDNARGGAGRGVRAAAGRRARCVHRRATPRAGHRRRRRGMGEAAARPARDRRAGRCHPRDRRLFPASDRHEAPDSDRVDRDSARGIRARGAPDRAQGRNPSDGRPRRSRRAGPSGRGTRRADRRLGRPATPGRRGRAGRRRDVPLHEHVGRALPPGAPRPNSRRLGVQRPRLQVRPAHRQRPCRSCLRGARVSESAAERYLRLGLQLGRHVEGIVDSYYGPPELAAAVEAEPPVDPRALVSAAEALLDELADGWLRDQVVGLRTYAGVLAGVCGSYADEVEGCYGVRPTYTDEAVFTAAHERLEELLPGEGPLAERYKRWEDSIRVPTEQVERAIAAVIEEARAQTRGLVELPDGEGVVLEIVRDKPWLAFSGYLGDLRSRIAVNVDLPMSAIELLHLTIHETYPGHHAERCSKDHLLVRGRGLLEETLVLVPTPQSLVSEGIAKLAPSLLLEGDGGPELAAVVHAAGIDFDLAHALAVREALEPCRGAE